MACGGTQNWELLCPICKSFIDTNYDYDLQRSLECHYLNVHSALRDVHKPTNHDPGLKEVKLMNKNIHFKTSHQPMSECTNYLICPLCDSVVEVFQNNINHCFMEHFEIHHQHLLILDTADVGPDQGMENLRLPDKNENPDSHFKVIKSKQFFDLPPDVEKHRGFIIFNSKYFLCQICEETLSEPQTMGDHLKTKTHEDNIILFLKNKLSNHMVGAMDFISFYGSNLCCNLCRCKVDWNSENPHETLLNIISHNSDVKHTQMKSKSDQVKINIKDIDIGSTILESITGRNAMINENKAYIEIELEPCFKCRLCDKTIQFSKNVTELEQNFCLHFKSLLHCKNIKAISALNFFKDLNGDKDKKHCFSVSNGIINCSKCECSVTANIEQLLEHCKNSSNVRLNQPSESKPSLNSFSQPDKVFSNKKNLPVEKNLIPEIKQKSENSSQIKPIVNPKVITSKEPKKSRVKEILHTLKNELGNITCIAETEDGKLTCLICNCLIQPSAHCVKMHIVGKFHKNKKQCQIKEFHNLNLSGGEINQDSDFRNKCTTGELHLDLVDHLFQSLPELYQKEKEFFTVNLMDGSVLCTLCDCAIDPLFILAHLKEETHILKTQKILNL